MFSLDKCAVCPVFEFCADQQMEIDGLVITNEVYKSTPENPRIKEFDPDLVERAMLYLDEFEAETTKPYPISRQELYDCTDRLDTRMNSLGVSPDDIYVLSDHWKRKTAIRLYAQAEAVADEVDYMQDITQYGCEQGVSYAVNEADVVMRACRSESLDERQRRISQLPLRIEV